MGNSASSLPYSIGKQVAFVNDGWALHEGERKSDKAAVTVFLAKKPALAKTPVNPRNPHMAQTACARHHFSNCKRLRHPHILTVLATLDTDHPEEQGASGVGSSPPRSGSGSSAEQGDLIVVTEKCTSLDTWLASQPPPEELAWGLECIVRGLHFLHASAGLCHGNLSPTSFYVTPGGDVKLWNFSLVSAINPQTGGGGSSVPRHFIEWEGLITPAEYRSPERVEGRWDAIGAAGVHAMDSYGLGVLIGCFFSGHVPQVLVKAVQRLQTANLKMRPRLQPLLKCPVFDTPYQKLQLQLEEFTVQPTEYKVQFWNNLTPQLQAGLVTENVAVYKLLPLQKQTIKTICENDTMKTQPQFRQEVLSILQPMFFIAENFLGDRVGAELGLLMGPLFLINDRAIRGTLLQKAPFMSQHFDQNTLNTAVFEPLCSGFSDSSSALRELTLKATLSLVPHLTHPNLEKLSRYLVRLQGDEEASIRTNTVIFFSKLAPHLTDMTRQKMLLPAFVRAMKDPFTPCRLAALKSCLKAKEFFDPPGIASRVLPAITPQLLDASAEVRKEAFQAVDELLFVLRQESERLNSLPEPGSTEGSGVAGQANGTATGKKTTAPPPAPSSAGGGWGLTSYFSKGSQSEAPKSAPAPARPPAPKPATPPRPVVPAVRPVAAAPVIPPPAPAAQMANMNFDDDWNDSAGDGWDEDDLLDLSSAAKKPLQFAGGKAPAPAVSSLLAPAAEDDFFGSFDVKPAKPAGMKKMGTGKLTVPVAKKGSPKSKKKPVAVKKITSDDDFGWDDF